MRQDGGLLLIIACVIAFGGPLLLGLAGLVGRREDTVASPPPRWDWRLSLASALCCTLAFNLVFFVQELFLVLPKAFTPGLEPVLFHNNHDWEGDNPLARLFQGTGALATLLLGLGVIAWLRRRRTGDLTLRLLLAWLAFCGVFMALPQVVTGAVLPDNDVGMAMDYLRLPMPVMAAAGALALAAMAATGLWLARRFIELAAQPAMIATRARRTSFVFTTAVLPGLAAIALLAPFRLPGSLDQVAIFPALVIVLGLVWILAGAWRANDVTAGSFAGKPRLVPPAIALVVVLLVFQLVLRPGVAF